MARVLADALAHYGLDHQLNCKMIGEIGEFLDVLGKYREGRASILDVLAELIDVQIVARQVTIGLDALAAEQTGETGIASEIFRDKLARLAERIKK